MPIALSNYIFCTHFVSKHETILYASLQSTWLFHLRDVYWVAVAELLSPVPAADLLYKRDAGHDSEAVCRS